MNRDHDPSRALRWTLLLALAINLLLAAGVYWGRNSGSCPPSIVGDWILDDLRTEGDDASPVTFYSTGVLDARDPGIATRWRFDDGRIHIRYWSKDGSTHIGYWLGDTKLNAWLSGSDEFPLIAAFNEERTVMTLTAPGEKPRLRLRRNKTDLSR